MEKNNGIQETTFISENLLIVAQTQDGKLVKTIGTKVKAEIIELNHVKVVKGDQEFFFELGEDVQWLELDYQ